MSSLADVFIDAALYLTEQKKGIESDGLDEVLLVITSELSSWGLDSVAAFQRTSIFVPSVCRKILRMRNEDKWPRKPSTIVEVYSAMHEEYQNLLKILSHQGGDIERAHDFCLLLHEAALQYAWGQSNRHGLAA